MVFGTHRACTWQARRLQVRGRQIRSTPIFWNTLSRKVKRKRYPQIFHSPSSLWRRSPARRPEAPACSLNILPVIDCMSCNLVSLLPGSPFASTRPTNHIHFCILEYTITQVKTRTVSTGFPQPFIPLALVKPLITPNHFSDLLRFVPAWLAYRISAESSHVLG